MSYRTNLNGKQIFGNDVCFEEWIEFIKSEGIKVDSDGCYKGEIKNVMGMFATVDKIIKRMIKERHDNVLQGVSTRTGKPLPELTDLSNSEFLNDETSILEFNMHVVRNAYCFYPYHVYLAVENVIERAYDEIYQDDEIDWSLCTYRVKKGKKIRVSAG